MQRAVDICRDLISIRSVTRCDDTIVRYVAKILENIGFNCEVLTFSSDDGTNVVHNLYAEYDSGKGGRNLGFLGHLDTVPAGDGWTYEPFSATSVDDFLYGRGIADMKGGVGCFLAALETGVEHITGKVSIFLTCDEEIGTYEGIQSVLRWAVEHKKIPDHCLIGEPSSDKKICDRMYIGHRGSINISAKACGEQMHSAYVTNDNKNNALERLCCYVSDVSMFKFDRIDNRFPECVVSPTMIKSANIAENVVPAYAEMNFNVRYSGAYTYDDIVSIFSDLAKKYEIEISYRNSGCAYICDDLYLLDIASKAVSDILGYIPLKSAGGGTSDGRFMIDLCPLIELGMIDETIHKANECVRISDCVDLANVYLRFLQLYFSS